MYAHMCRQAHAHKHYKKEKRAPMKSAYKKEKSKYNQSIADTP